MSTTSFDPTGFATGTSPVPPAEGGVDAQLVQETRNQIRVLVQEVTQLAASDVPLTEFYDGLLTRVVSALAATGGAVWSRNEEGRLDLAYQVSFDPSALEGNAASRHALLLRRVVRDRQPLAAPPRSGFPDDDEAGNPTDQLILLSPILVEQEVTGLLEVFQRPGAGPTTQRGYLRFLAQMCDLAGDFLRNHRLRRFNERAETWKKLEQFLTELHQSLDLRATSLALVNEGRLLVDCDRVSLAIKQGRQFRVTTVSGLDDINRRTQQTTLLSELIDAVAATGDPFWRSHEQTPLAPQIEEPLEAYIDKSHTKAIGIVPLFASNQEQEPLGAIVFERMDESRWEQTHRDRAATVVQYGAPAIAHALAHERIFLRSLWTWLGNWRAKLDASAKLKLGVIGGTVAAALLGLAIIPAPMAIAARGKLQPSQRWDIFAPEAGTVINVPVRHGQTVSAGDLLAQLQNTEVEVQLTELLGRQRVAQEQLEASQRAILDSGRGGRPRLTIAEENRLGGEVLQLRQTLVSIERELELVRKKQENLTVRAPHGGEVVTWQLEQRLQRRPVQPGQALLTLVEPNGPWELELNLPERRLKHIDAALAGQNDAPLAVTFILSTSPGREFRGQVVEIERSADVRGEEGNTVLVRVAFNRDEVPTLHADTTVTAKIHCGYRPVGYVWFCDLFEAAQTSVLFWL